MSTYIRKHWLQAKCKGHQINVLKRLRWKLEIPNLFSSPKFKMIVVFRNVHEAISLWEATSLQTFPTAANGPQCLLGEWVCYLNLRFIVPWSISVGWHFIRWSTKNCLALLFSIHQWTSIFMFPHLLPNLNARPLPYCIASQFSKSNVFLLSAITLGPFSFSRKGWLTKRASIKSGWKRILVKRFLDENIVHSFRVRVCVCVLVGMRICFCWKPEELGHFLDPSTMEEVIWGPSFSMLPSSFGQ